MRLEVLLALLSVATSALAQYRCVENGKTVFTDRPCATELPVSSRPQPQPAAAATAGDAAYSTTAGAWRGQAQFQATVNGAVVGDAHSVVPMVIEIDPQGKITGVSTDNGCRLLGVASPGFLPTMANLDITFTNCEYPGFNRRMSGTLSVYQGQKHAQLSLNGIQMAPGRIAATYDIRATLRR